MKSAEPIAVTTLRAHIVNLAAAEGPTLAECLAAANYIASPAVTAPLGFAARSVRDERTPADERDRATGYRMTQLGARLASLVLTARLALEMHWSRFDATDAGDAEGWARLGDEILTADEALAPHADALVYVPAERWQAWVDLGETFDDDAWWCVAYRAARAKAADA